MYVYLIHFDEPYHHAQHYIGRAKSISKRIEHHRKGSGACLMRAVTAAGIGWSVVRLWITEDNNFEHQLKARKNAKKFCPICNPENFKKHFYEGYGNLIIKEYITQGERDEYCKTNYREARILGETETPESRDTGEIEIPSIRIEKGI